MLSLPCVCTPPWGPKVFLLLQVLASPSTSAVVCKGLGSLLSFPLLVATLCSNPAKVVRRPRAHKVDHSESTFTWPLKKENFSFLGRRPFEKPRFVCCQCRPGPFGQTVAFFLCPSSCTSCYGNQRTLAIKASFRRCCGWSFEVILCLGPLFVQGRRQSSTMMVGCRSRHSWTVGSIPRARSGEVSVARRPCPLPPDVRLCPRQYWQCYFNVQRYLSPEVSVRFIFFRLSISGRRASNNRLLSRSLYMYVRDEPRWS